MTIQIAIFYMFSLVAVLSAVKVVTSDNPIYSALSLVLTFFACSGLWMLAHAEFLSLILVLVYVGAVMTLFLFVIMMINIDMASAKKHFVKYLPYGLGVVGLLVFLMLAAIRPENFGFPHLTQAQLHGVDYSNTRELGLVLYTDYAYGFIMAGALLLVAIISAISLVHRPARECNTQNPVDQIKVRKEDRVRLVKIKAVKRK